MKRTAFALIVGLIVGASGLAVSYGLVDDPSRNVVLQTGTPKEELIGRLGEPDSYQAYSHGGSEVINGKNIVAPYEGHFVEHLRYGSFPAYRQKTENISQYRLNLKFVNGTLQSWSRHTPKLY